MLNGSHNLLTGKESAGLAVGVYNVMNGHLFIIVLKCCINKMMQILATKVCAIFSAYSNAISSRRPIKFVNCSSVRMYCLVIIV